MSPTLVARSLGLTALALPLAGLLWVVPAQSAQQPAVLTVTGLTAEIRQTERDLRRVQSDLLHLAQSNYGISDPNAIERRFAALEQEIQRLTGQIERLGFEQRQIADRLERMQSDMEFRLTRLEGGNPASGSSGTSGGSSGGASGSFSSGGSSGGSSGSFGGSTGQAQSGAGGVQTLGSVSAQELQQLQGLGQQGLGQGQTASVGQSGGGFSDQQNFQTGALTGGSFGSQQNSATPPATASLPSGSAEEQYKHAFGLLRKADYQGAEQALKAFVQSNPGDPLVANAKYWLGETYYVRGNYNDASQAFAQAYQDHQNGPKAADSLLKLGLSLSLLGRTNEACQVLQELQARMGSSARANILNRGRREQTNLGC